MTVQRVILVGPDCRGIGGIESVLRAYGQIGLPGYDFEYLTTWNKTIADRKRVPVFARALVDYVLRLREWRQVRPLFHVHLSHKGSFLREGLFLFVSRVLGFKTFATVHGSAFVRTAHDSRFWFMVYKILLKFACRISVLNEDALAAARQLGFHNVVIMNNPGPVFNSSEFTSAGDCPPIAVFAGSVGRRKGVDTLLAAWKIVNSRVPDAELFIVGPAEDAEVVEAAGSYWKGPMDASSLFQLLGSSRLAVLPSTAEAMPMFLIEAMGCGRPLVVTNVGAMAGQAEDCGLVSVVGDVQQLASAIVAYLSDRTRASEHGSIALEKYNQLYGRSAVNAALNRFFGSVVKSMELS
ncbi:hypothetical protein GCM10009696_20720 [Kocuria himachalensis]